MTNSIKPILNKNKRYFIEFILIFFSVVLAFYFEDYRAKKEERKNYITALQNFRADLHSEFLSVKSDMNSNLARDSLFNEIRQSSDPIFKLSTLKQIPATSLSNLTPISQWYHKLSDYPFLIEDDELGWMMKWYLHNTNTRQKMYSVLGATISDYWNAHVHEIDLVNIHNSRNGQFGESLEFNNTVQLAHELLLNIISFDDYHSNNFLETEIENLDIILQNEGIHGIVIETHQ